ncbi:hypothetical protein E1B28_011852 [Marasmius oreades]|uniref:Uncharacterized protein n=1 Tax=Marasmius oreades TaxID=181124 RepID=A0A9P7RV64_9AGAR|nr:uncharacterized protein E1B28_011852 [Marasmius oreades]KAG7090255.1 hypothetical protein E1B28_011852 [Marasmius oreades]
METWQVQITRPTFTPVQHNTTINDSYNTTTRNNQGSHNRAFNNGGRRRQEAEIGPWREDSERNIQRHKPYPSSKSDGGLWESPIRTEHEAIGTSSSAPPAFHQPHSTQHQSHIYSRSVELDKARTTDNCPTCGRPWHPQTGTRDVTGHYDDNLQDNDLHPRHDHYEHDISAPQPRFDEVPSIHRPREARSGRSTSDWPSDYPYTFVDRDRHGPNTAFDDQYQPLLLSERNSDDRPASSRHPIRDPYPERYNTVPQESKPSRQSYTPRLSSERLVDTRTRVAPPPPLPHPSDERFEGVRSSRFPEETPHVVHHAKRPRKNERNVAVDYDVRESATSTARSQDRVYKNERLVYDSNSLFESHKQVFSSQYPSDTHPAQDKEFVAEFKPAMKSEYNPFRRNRNHTANTVTSTSIGSASSFGKNPFASN